jgi:hypothetical protein
MTKLCSICLLILMMAQASSALDSNLNVWSGDWRGTMELSSFPFTMSLKQDYGYKNVEGTFSTYYPVSQVELGVISYEEVKGTIQGSVENNILAGELSRVLKGKWSLPNSTGTFEFKMRDWRSEAFTGTFYRSDTPNFPRPWDGCLKIWRITGSSGGETSNEAVLTPNQDIGFQLNTGRSGKAMHLFLGGQAKSEYILYGGDTLESGGKTIYLSYMPLESVSEPLSPTRIVMGPNSILDSHRDPEWESSEFRTPPTLINFFKGTMKLITKDPIKIYMPSRANVLVKGTTLTVSTDPEKKEDLVQVENGTVEVTLLNSSKNLTLHDGQQVKIGPEGAGDILPYVPPPETEPTNYVPIPENATEFPGPILPGSSATGNATNGTSSTAGNLTLPGQKNQTGSLAPGSSGPASGGTVSGPVSLPSGTASPANNNQIGDAAEVAIGQAITQNINPAGSSNFYKFYVNASGIVKFKLENPPKDMKADLNLHDKNFGSIAYKAAANPGDTVSLEKDILGPGWFYLEVRDQAGKANSDPYSLKISFKSAPDQFEPNPNLFRATEVKSGRTINAYICPVNDEDYYKIYADTSGILKLKLDAVPKDMKSEISIRDKAAGQIAYATASNPGDKVSLEKDLQGPGWFFIEVRNPEGKAHSDPYSLEIAFEAAPDQYEPNPNFFRATQATSGQSITAYICPVNDEDFYKFYVASQAIAKVKLESVPEDMKGELSIYDKAAGQIAYSTASNPGDKVNLEKDLKGPGWFFIKVRDVNGKAHSQPYTMTAAF